MEVLQHPVQSPIRSARLSAWRLLITPPLTGEENMAVDRETLDRVIQGHLPLMVRFFRWSRPEASHGRLQRAAELAGLVPKGWPVVKRPTGGGLVLHGDDVCLSICWRDTDERLPRSATEIYRFIHTQLLEALSPLKPLRMAACCDAKPISAPFHERQCFVEPVGYDLLEGNVKRVGGALWHSRGAWLYQGSLQAFDPVAASERVNNVLVQRWGSPE